MSASSSRITELSIEVLEHILSHLPGQDIIMMEAVNRCFADLVRGSPILQYRCELFSAGLIDNPHHPCNLVERRKLCKEYVDKWTGKVEVVKRTYQVPGEHPTRFTRVVTLGGDLLGLKAPDGGEFYQFLRVPPGGSQRPIEGWEPPKLPFYGWHSAAYPPADLLVVAELRERIVYIHLRSLQNGTVYGTPPSGTITYAFPSGTPTMVFQLAVTRSRVMACLSTRCRTEGMLRLSTRREAEAILEVVVVWDVKTGDPVLEVPSYGYQSHVTFLDEFRIMVSRYDNTADTSDLVVFDTRILQSRPDVFQRFGLPSRYHTDRVRARVDCNRPMGMAIREDPFTADPAQAVFVLELSLSGKLDSCVLLVVRISALVGRTGSYIRWEEWAGGFVAAEIPLVRNTVTTFVHGAYVAVAVISERGYCRLCTFDFSKRGCHALPLWGGESGVGGRRFALKNDGRDVPLEGILRAGRVPWPEAMGLLGDGVVVYLDSAGSGAADRDTLLHTWELLPLSSSD